MDKDEAVVLLEERRKDRDGEAMWMLGICKEYGIGCEQDLKEAEGLYKECCECGNVVGKFFVEIEEEDDENERGGLAMYAYSL